LGIYETERFKINQATIKRRMWYKSMELDLELLLDWKLNKAHIKQGTRKKAILKAYQV
jgi:hypothetical protein